MIEILTRPEYGFLRTAYLLSAIASVSFGLIGSFVVVRRIGYLAGAVSHCAFGGIGIGIWLQQTIATGSFGVAACLSPGQRNVVAGYIDPVLAATFFGIAGSLLISMIHHRYREREDTIIGIIWSLGMAIGLLFLDKTTGYVPVSGYLFGDIILISNRDLYMVSILGAIIVLCTLFWFREFQAICFDDEFARLRNIPVDRFFSILLVLTAATIVLMLRVVGMILVIALLTIPAATAARLTRRLVPMIFTAIAISMIGCWSGLTLSFLLNFSAGPSIIAVISLFYFIAITATARSADKSSV